MVFATLSIGALSLGVWAHHMFTTGVVLLPFFSFMSLMIAVPTGIKIFNWIGTMWRGELWFLHRHVDGASASCLRFLIGGLTGIYLASPPLDFFTHDTYFVVAHFHSIVMALVLAGMGRPVLLGSEDHRVICSMRSSAVSSFWFLFIGTQVFTFPQ